MGFLLLFIFLAAAAFAQQPIRVTNAASAGFGPAAPSVAPGSLIRVDLVPSGTVVPIDPRSVTIEIQPAGSATVVEPSDPLGVIALLSSDTPPGPAMLSMNFNGQTSAPASIEIVPTSFGLFTRGNGIGPVLASNSLTRPAQPGDVVTLWGTGLGSATQDQVSVMLGGHPFPVEYAGPAPGLPGTDQINFQIPNDPTIPYGCYVAIAIRAQDVTSNTGTISTGLDSNPCHSVLGFTPDQLAQLDAGQNVTLGQVDLYDMVGPPAPQQWFYSNGFTRMESADASFLNVNAVTVAVLAQPLQAADSYYGCYASSVAGASLIAISGAVDAGNNLVLSSSDQTLDLPRQNPEFPGGFYSVQLPASSAVDSPDAVPAPFFSAGVWQVSSAGSATLQPFTGSLTVARPPRIADPSSLATIDHTQDLTVRWNGSDYTDDLTAVLQLAASSVVICRAPASAGQITIPAGLMQNLAQSAANNGLELLLMPRPDRVATFQASLRNGGTVPVLFRSYPSEVIPIQIQ